MKRPRLTAAEIDILLSVIGFVNAGEISGGPLQADTEHPKYAHDDYEHPDVKRKSRALDSARQKLCAMLENRESSRRRPRPE